jgi:hypothetical protein
MMFIKNLSSTLVLSGAAPALECFGMKLSKQEEKDYPMTTNKQLGFLAPKVCHLALSFDFSYGDRGLL